MNEISVLVVENNKDLSEVIENFLREHSDIQVVGTAIDGIQALEKIKERGPDIVLLDIIMPYLDGIEVLKELSNLKLAKKPKIIVLTAFEEENLIMQSSNFAIAQYILKPFDKKVLIERIRQVADKGFEEQYRKPKTHIDCVRETNNIVDLETKVAKMLKDINIPMQFKGYIYLKDSIIIATKDPSTLGCITKEIYPKVAEANNTTNLLVEASIRYAIKKAWREGERDKISAILDINKKKSPTNAHLIAKISERIRLEMLDSYD